MRRRFALLTSLTLTGVLAVASPAAAQTEELRVDGVDVGGHPDVRVDVTVPANLEVADASDRLRVLEDGVPVDAEAAQADSADLQVVLLIDTTGSMGGGPLDAAKAAASAFLSRLPSDAKVAVVGYDVDTTVVSGFEASRGDHLAGIDQLRAEGSTAMYDAVATSLGIFGEGGDNDRRAIVLLTDGEDNESRAALDDVVEQLGDSGVVLHGIEYQTAYSDETGVRALTEISAGTVQAADDPDALVGIYDQLAADLVSSYEIHYETAKDGPVTVTVEFDTGGERLTSSTEVTFPSQKVVQPPEPAPPVAPVPAEAVPGWTARAGLVVGGTAWFAALLVLLVALFAPRGPRSQLTGAASRMTHGRTGAHEVAERATVLAGRALERSHYQRGLNAALERAGINLRPDEFVVLVTSGTVAALILGTVLSGFLGGLVLACLVLLGSRLTVSIKGDRRQSRFADQLGDTLQLLSGSLRAGYSLMQAVDAVARDADAPSSEEFGRLVVETRLGRDASDALRALAARLGSDDFEWVIQAIEIHREVGGDLAEVLDNVGATIRERDQIRRQVKTVSAEGRMSGWVLLGLPFFIGFWMLLTNPTYAGELTSGVIGWSMLAVCAVLMTAGALWIRVLVRLKF